MESKRDGFASVQLDGNQVIAQTRSGLIALLDAENAGRALWRSRPGRIYEAVLAPAVNSHGVYVNDSGAVYGLDRVNGSLLWKYELRVALSAPLSVDEDKLYIENVEARLIAARLPHISKAPPKTTTGSTAPSDVYHNTDQVGPGVNLTIEDVRPLIVFDFDTNQRVETKAVLGPDVIFLAIPSGAYLGVPKTGDAMLGNTELYRYSGDSRFTAPLGYSDTAAYIATSDSHVYAIDIGTGKVVWRYFPGRPVVERPTGAGGRRRGPRPVRDGGGQGHVPAQPRHRRAGLEDPRRRLQPRGRPVPGRQPEVRLRHGSARPDASYRPEERRRAVAL